MLEAGGLRILADDATRQRINVHHPDGIYEIKDVGGFLAESETEATAGCALKLVTQYLEWLPMDRPVRVIYMVRNVHEIVASLLAQKVVWEDDPVSAIRRGRQILLDCGVPLLDVQYRDMIQYPRATATTVAEFVEPGLGITLDVEAMAAVADPKARQKSYEAEGKTPELVTYQFDPGRVRVLG
jgi:hypothetical protein